LLVDDFLFLGLQNTSGVAEHKKIRLGLLFFFCSISSACFVLFLFFFWWLVNFCHLDIASFRFILTVCSGFYFGCGAEDYGLDFFFFDFFLLF
jgi:hypothetical protein